VPHAEALRELIPGAEILTASGDSKLSPKRRKEVLQRMKTKELMCIIGTSLLDEGVDVPSATAGIFAGGGKSSTRELQRVGRFIRRDKDDPNKTCAFIEEFFDHTKWLMNHAKLRRKILETEPQFEITDNRATMSL
jgi:superfamily II DNA or RNA helicase